MRFRERKTKVKFVRKILPSLSVFLGVAWVSCLWVGVMAQPSNLPPVVNLGWTPSTSPAANVMGYWIWQGNASSNYSRVVFVPGWGSSQVTLTNLVRGTNYFWNITALGTNAAAGLESPYDGEVSTNFAAPPNSPTGLKIIAVP